MPESDSTHVRPGRSCAGLEPLNASQPLLVVLFAGQNPIQLRLPADWSGERVLLAGRNAARAVYWAPWKGLLCRHYGSETDCLRPPRRNSALFPLDNNCCHLLQRIARAACTRRCESCCNHTVPDLIARVVAASIQHQDAAYIHRPQDVSTRSRPRQNHVRTSQRAAELRGLALGLSNRNAQKCRA